MVAKRFFYVCAGIFLLALSYHLGARSATAQAPGNPVVGGLWPSTRASALVTANGDVYVTNDATLATGWQLATNIFSAPTPAQQESWGGVKDRYRR